MSGVHRIYKIFRYGIGPAAKERRKADKARIRKEKFESENWQHGEDIARRNYGSYDEYVSHQAAKLDTVVNRLRNMEEEDFAEFYRRFKDCKALSDVDSVLCLGARLGTEVKALHALGYFSIGIDLNPGKDNPYVVKGDFHHLVFPDASVGAVYTNALDHVFDVDKVITEVARVLKPGGVFILDLTPGYEEGFVPGEYAANSWESIDSLSKRIADTGNMSIDEKRDLGQLRRDPWFQVVFRKLHN
jgi:SAM-dependent methyltransferase